MAPEQDTTHRPGGQADCPCRLIGPRLSAGSGPASSTLAERAERMPRPAQAARRRIEAEPLLQSSASTDRIVSPTRTTSLGDTSPAATSPGNPASASTCLMRFSTSASPGSSLSGSSPTTAQVASTSAHVPIRNTGPSRSGNSGLSSSHPETSRSSMASSYASSASAMGASTSTSMVTAGWSTRRPSKTTARTRTLAATLQCAGSAAIIVASGTSAVSKHGAFRALARCVPEKRRSPSEPSAHRGPLVGTGSLPAPRPIGRCLLLAPRTQLLVQRLQASDKREHRLLRRGTGAGALPGPLRFVRSLAACLLAVARAAHNPFAGRLPPTLQTQADRMSEHNGATAQTVGMNELKAGTPSGTARSAKAGSQGDPDVLRRDRRGHAAQPPGRDAREPVAETAPPRGRGSRQDQPRRPLRQ